MIMKLLCPPFQLAIGLLLLAGLNSCEQPAAEATLSDESLRVAIATFNEAFARGDAEEIAGLITQDYRHTNGTSTAIDRETWLNYIRQREETISSGELAVNDYGLTELGISRHGEMAIVTGKVSVVQTREGERSEQAYRITNIWVVEDGKWKRAGFHDGKIQ